VEIQNLPPSHPAHCYRGVWDQLSVHRDGHGRELLVLDGVRVVVPRGVRPKILDLLHLPHAGLVKTRQSARQLYYWPGMSAAIADKVEGCETCVAALPSKPLAQALPPTTASRAMQAVGMDLFQAEGKDYLIMVDRYSGFPFVAKLSSTSAAAVVRAASSWFDLFGLPAVVRADGGPQFRGQDFRNFCEAKGIDLETSSPYNPRSNGLAEAAVKNCKKLLGKCLKGGEDFGAALLEFRNCPRADGFSPSQLMFGRRSRTALPALAAAFRPINRTYAEVARGEGHKKGLEKIGNRPLDTFVEGEEVWVQNRITGAWDDEAWVLSRADSGASYTLFFPSSEKISRRNERFLRHKKPSGGGERGARDADSADSDAPNVSISHADPESFDPIPLRRSDRLRQRRSILKTKTNSTPSARDKNKKVRFATLKTIRTFRVR